MFFSEGFHSAPPADVTKQCWLRNSAALAFLSLCSVDDRKHVQYDDDDTSVDSEPVHLIKFSTVSKAKYTPRFQVGCWYERNCTTDYGRW
jgi:hypothetical protein